MIPICDYHMHTPLSGHAVGQPEEYVKQAIKVGLKEMGFSDHAPLVSGEDPSIAMSFEQLPEYHKMIEKARESFSDITIKIGIEAEFTPGLEEKTKAILSGYPYDYVIGSVHFIKDWGFDNPDQREQWNEQDVNAVYKDYFALIRASAASGLFDIMGHVDLVKKFGHRATEDMTAEVEKTAEAFKKAQVAIEINTSGLRKTVREIYPSLEALKIYCSNGIPITFGSDSHHYNDVGRDFDKAAQLAKEAGYKEYVLFKARKIEQSVPL